MIEIFTANLPLILALAAAGITAGLAAGLFGIGGGAVIVPVLFFLFSGMGFEDRAMHVAVATSLATIIITSARSVMAHHKRGAVDWSIVKSWTPWIVLGSVGGMILAGYVPGRSLTILFGVMSFVLAAQLFFGRPTWKLMEDMPDGAGRAGLGAGMGALSAMMGIGGGTLGVSLMTVCGRTIHQAVATAAGFGFAIGAPAAIAAVFTGWGRAGLPPFSAGFVNLPAFALIAVFTVTMAPVGARLAHSLDAQLLRRLFAVVLAIVGARMLYSSFGG